MTETAEPAPQIQAASSLSCRTARPMVVPHLGGITWIARPFDEGVRG